MWLLRKKSLLTLIYMTGLALLSPSVTAEEKPATDKTEKSRLPMEELRTFTQVYEQIRSSYVEEVDDPTLLKNAIIGMLTQLDPHSAYLDKESFESLQETTSGEFGGLGIEVGIENGFVKVISPIDDTPAQRAGIMAGDLIVKLDDTPVKGMTLDDAVKKMRGLKGTSILLTVLREGVDKPLEIKLVRDTIKVVSVRTSLIEADYGYARIAQFQVSTSDDLRAGLEKIQAENKKPLKGVIIDLRNNPGGVLQSSVSVADLFLESGDIVSTKGRVENSNMDFEATPGDILNGAPMVVLINEGSASASEIVAGALQDQKRAIIIGTQSFGKGSVQTVIPLSQEQAIKLTTARYYTPSGRSIQAEGIVPDIIVEPAVLKAVEVGNGMTKEANLAGHLENDKSAKISGDKKPAAESQASALAERLKSDNQLHDALNALKVIVISQQRSEAK